jgi:chromatin structure-remodeling complex subunit RSC1/2
MTPSQAYQASLQRRASNFATPQTPAGAYQASPVAQPYSAVQPSPYTGYSQNRMQAPPAVYNPNAPRPVEVFHLSDAANAAIPEDIRHQFHCDDQGRVLFFSTPPVDFIPPSNPKLGHSLKYLATKEEHQKKVAERKRKLADEQAEHDEAAKRHRADVETNLAARVQGLTGKAFETLVQRVVSGTGQLLDSLHGAQYDGAMDVDGLRERGALADRLAKEQTRQIQAQSTTESLVNLKGTALYLGEA